MNWVNLIFYIACAITGFCYLLWKLRIARLLPKIINDAIVWVGELFWVIVIIFLLRSFFVEPFRIPSSSMMPTMEDGDFILVNKYIYGLRLPGFNFKFTQGEKPKRGDIIVFRYPPNPTQDYIKRLIAIPGDTIEYKSKVLQNSNHSYVQKTLLINGKEVLKELLTDATTAINSDNIKVYKENILGKQHQMREHNDRFILSSNPSSFMSAMQCVYDVPVGFRCTVPEGQYFMLGDNRDESADSRYWGFVPEENLVGKAFYIWFNFSKLSRIGSVD